MSIMGDSLNKWSKPKVSYLHQEEISILNPLDIQNRMQGHTQVIVEKSSVCQKLEQSVRAAMLDWCDESDKKYIEIGAAITEDWKLGEKVSGTKDQVAIHRPQGTIGIFHTHPHGSDLPSPHDFIDTLDKKDKVSCIGGTGQYGNNVACYEPNEPFYTTLRNELEALDKAINIYTLKTQHKYRSKGRRLKRMLRSVSEGYYRDVQESVPDEVYEKKLVDANERVENTMSMLVIARSNLAAAREELKGIVRSPFSGEVTSGRDIDVAEENIKTATEGLVTNLRNYNNAVADKEEAEKVLFFRKATDKPALVAEVDAAKDLLREGAELEQRRIKLIQEINNQRQLIAYGCAGSNAGGWQCKGRPLAFKTCRVTRDYFEPSEEPGL
jgi:hypothetical protein